MKIHIATYKREMKPGCDNYYKYNYFVVFWINDNEACFSHLFENRPYLRKKLTKNIIKGIKKAWGNDSSLNNLLKQYYDHPGDVKLFTHTTDCIWKQIMNIFYII